MKVRRRKATRRQKWKTRAYLNGFVKDVDKLVKENNP